MEITAQSRPLNLFEQWMAEAKATTQIKEPTAMSVATCSANGDLHVRVVLCKGWSEAGFVFYTNYESRKGRELDANPHIAAVFYWDPLFRQIKITGQVERVPRQQSIEYWRTRPRESQLSQWVSRQSQPIVSREQMESEWRAAEQEFAGREVPCPDHWGGYLIRPKTIEFWIGMPGRFHDRHQFEAQGNAWSYSRLYP